MDDERYRREEEERRAAEERRRRDRLADEEGRRRRSGDLFGELPSFDLERGRRGEGEDRPEREPRPETRSGRGGYDRESLDRESFRGESAGESGGGRRGGSSIAQQARGLYGSSVGGNVVRSAVAELVGTFILIFAGTAVAVGGILQLSTVGPGPGFYDSLAVALAFGLALSAIVAAIGHVSGAHVNPAVTLSLAATNKFPWEYVPVYLGAQLVGAILGAIATWIAYGDAAREVALLASTFPPDFVNDIQAFLVEALITFILVFVVISVATDDRAPAGIAPLAVGFALAVGVLIAGPVTGGSVNPARTLGPALVAFNFDAIWVYILGPIVGGLAAAFLYDRFVSDADAP